MTLEANRLEYKLRLIYSLEKEVTTFLNYHDDDIIYIGIVDKADETIGIEIADKIQLKVKDRTINLEYFTWEGV